jgi:hypothetical protein
MLNHPDRNVRFHDYHTLSPFDECKNHHLFKGKQVVVFTARPVNFRTSTEEWLKRNQVPFVSLMMRNLHDHRSSVDLKREQISWLVHEGLSAEDIEHAYDDRPDVVQMYLDAGIPATVVAITSVETP